MAGSIDRTAGHASGVDPHVAEFVRRLNAAYADHDMPTSPSERRAIAEIVRGPWRAGGPAMATTRDLTHGGVRMRLHRPVDAPALPVMIYIHGGGWTLFSIDTHDRLMREYAHRAGIAVLGIDYGLAPENKFPIALDQIAAAIDWVQAEGAGHGIDPATIFIGGDSAGANLSVATSLRRRDRGLPPLAGMILNYGAFDPAPTASYARFVGPLHNLEVPEMEEFWSNYVTDREQLDDPLVSPLRAALHDLPPTVMAIAECDILADSNHAFAEKMAAAGGAVTAHVYHGATHSFLEAVSIAPIAARALEDQAAWLRGRIDAGAVTTDRAG